MAQLCVGLMDFANHYEANHSGAIQFVVGESGIGKSSLLLRLRQQIAQAPEFDRWITIYLPLADLRRDPAGLARTFLQELEKNVIDNNAKRETINNFFTNPKWHRIIAQISPGLFSIVQSSISGAKTVSLAPFFKQLRDYYQNPALMRELLVVCNMLLQDSGYFLLCIMDHLEELRHTPPAVAREMLSAINDLGKKSWRYFALIGIDEKELANLAESMEIGELDPLPALLSRHSAMVISEESKLSHYSDQLSKSLLCGNRFPVVAVRAEANYREITNALYTRCRLWSSACLVECPPQPELNAHLTKVAQSIIKETSSISVKMSQSWSALAKPDDLNSFQLQGTDDMDAIAKFSNLLDELDQYLLKYTEGHMVVFWKNFEHLLPLASSKTAKIQSKTRKIIGGITGVDFYSPSTTFLALYSSLLQRVYSLKRIAVVPLFILPAFVFPPPDTFNPRELFIKSAWKLKPLGAKDSASLLQEIAMRCGVSIPKEITADIYRLTGGNPLLLHSYGHYLLATLQKTFTAREIEQIRKRLLRPYEPEIDAGLDKLCREADGRNRLLVSAKHYADTAAFPPPRLYAKILSQDVSPAAGKIAEILSRQNDWITGAGLAAALKSEQSKFSKEQLLAGLQQLEDLRVIARNPSGELAIIHPLIKALINQASTLDSGGETEKLMETAVSTRKIDMKKVVDKIAHIQSSEATERIFLEEKTPGTSEFLQQAISWLKAGQLPDASTLKKISTTMNFEESSPLLPASMCYLAMLCERLREYLGLSQDVDEAVSAARATMEGPDPDLKIAIEQVFLGQDTTTSLEMKNDYRALSKLSLLEYRFFENHEELEKSVAFFAKGLLEAKFDSAFWELERELERTLLSDREIPNAQELRGIVAETVRAVSILGAEDNQAVALEILQLTPGKVNPEFHKYMLHYLESLISKNISPTLRDAALRLIGQYGHVAQTSPHVLELLDEVVRKAEFPANKQAAGYALSYFFPFINASESEEILSLMQSWVMEEYNPDLRLCFIDILANACQVRHAERFIEFLHLLVDDPNLTVRMAAGYDLACHRHLGAPEKQAAIAQAVAKCCDLALHDMELSKIPDYIETLLISSPKDEGVRIAREVRAGVLGGDVDLWHRSAAALGTVFPVFSGEEKEKLAATLAGWLADDDFAKRMAGYSYFHLLYPYAGNITEVLENIVGGSFSLEQELIFKNIWRWLDKLESPAHICQTMADLLQTYSREQSCADLYPCHLKNVASIIPSCSGPMRAQVAAAMFKAIKTGVPEIVSATFHVAPDVIFYIAPEQQEELQKLSYYAIVLDDVCPDLWAGLLRMLCRSSFLADDIYNESVFYKIADLMKLCPRELLGPALQFFAGMWTKLPPELASRIQKDAGSYLSFQEHAEDALAFLIRCGENMSELRTHAYLYQFYRRTMHLAFSLYEKYPELADVNGLAQNYESVLHRDPYDLILKIADFEFRAGFDKRAQEWIDWLLERSISPVIKLKALFLQRKWQLAAGNKDGLLKTVMSIYETTFA